MSLEFQNPSWLYKKKIDNNNHWTYLHLWTLERTDNRFRVSVRSLHAHQDSETKILTIEQQNWHNLIVVNCFHLVILVSVDWLEWSSCVATLTDTALISAKRFVICLKYCSGVRATRSLYTIFLKSEKMCAQYVDP